MAVLNCKMCGGTLDFEQGSTIGVCEYCGTKQTLPRLDTDRKINLLKRANHFRRNNEYDKAEGIYEQILNEDTSDAETYWSLVLCCYGIEYVEDPETHKRIPTVNRAQYTSVFDNENYKLAIKYADIFQRELYEKEANEINSIQKKILEISQKEKPYDVFICYKETDNNGKRTPDSVLANDLYHQLTQEGFRVFFSRITLEDKIGMAYEPYIFAALNSAKVMVVIGTKLEYFNSAWVKNEWSRYLALIKKSNGEKVLIPAYRDMDPYDLPDEFAHLQAQDMSKLGFVQDLIRGIKKIIKNKSTTINEPTTDGIINVSAILRRASLCLEDGEWEKADSFCEQALNQEPENAEAYFIKLMAEMHVCKKEDLAKCRISFEDNKNYQKAIRFGNEKLVASLNDLRCERIYNNAMCTMATAKSESDFKMAINMFNTISGFKNADQLASKCLVKANNKRQKRAKIANVFAITIVAAAVFLFLLLNVIIPNIKYNSAVALYNAKMYTEAIKAFEALDDYKDSKKYLDLAFNDYNYDMAVNLYNNGEYNKAISAFFNLSNYKSSVDYLVKSEIQLIKQSTIGSYVIFGKYEQDNDNYNGKEQIRWQILAKENNKVLLISDDGLDYKPFNTTDADVTWETCSLRKWLNTSFYNDAFMTNEKKYIQNTLVSADKNKYYKTSAGNNTTDNVFLLSDPEIYEYYDNYSLRSCYPTKYAIEQGASITSSLYWLRTPGESANCAACMWCTGYGYPSGWLVKHPAVVRPVIWISID